MIKGIMSLCDMITLFIMVINYCKCKNIVSKYFYIKKLIIPFTYCTPPKTQSKTGTLRGEKKEGTNHVGGNRREQRHGPDPNQDGNNNI